MNIRSRNTAEDNEKVAFQIVNLLSKNNCNMLDAANCLQYVNDILKYQEISPREEIVTPK